MSAQGLPQRQDTILALLRQRDEQGVQLLFEHYGGALNTIVQQVIPDPRQSEEVLHDVLLKIWTNIDKYDESKSRLYTWMARLARNTAIDYVRSKDYRKTAKTDALSPLVSNHSSHSHTPSTNHIGLRSLLDRLDGTHRSIIELLYFKDYTQAETAKELDLPLGTVKTRARRAIKQLRTLLGPEVP